MHHLNFVLSVKVYHSIEIYLTIYLNKKIGEQTIVDEPIFTMYSESAYNLKEAKDSLDLFPVLEY